MTRLAPLRASGGLAWAALGLIALLAGLAQGVSRAPEAWPLAIGLVLVVLAALGTSVREHRIEPGAQGPVLVAQRLLWGTSRVPLDASTVVAVRSRVGRLWLVAERGSRRIELPLAVVGGPQRTPAEAAALADAVRPCLGGPAVAHALIGGLDVRGERKIDEGEHP